MSMVGKTILHYRILKEIGKGGMGVVYKAEDTKLHRAVAIKALSADLVGDEKARARFLREARAASAIDHPNICTVYEVNEVEDVLFFVMQYVDGKTLKRFIGGRPLPRASAAHDGHRLRTSTAGGCGSGRALIVSAISGSTITAAFADDIGTGALCITDAEGKILRI